MGKNKKHNEIYRPYWVEPDMMKNLGYELVSDDGTYLKYVNVAGLEVDDYGLMPKGKRIIYFNCEYNKFSKLPRNVVYTAIEEDGGTRKVFAGVCDSESEFNTIHRLVR